MKCNRYGTSFQLGVLAIVIAMLPALVGGCASGKDGRGGDAVQAQPSFPMIMGLAVEEAPDAVSVIIKGNRGLVFASERQVSPPALILRFPEAGLDPAGGVYRIDAPAPLIASVSAVPPLAPEGAENAVRVNIDLNADAPHEIQRDGDQVRVIFSKSGTSRQAAASASETDFGFDANAESDQWPPQTATRLESVWATKLDDSLKVFVGADGAITNYKAFTIDSPARIVFDIFNLKSPYSNEKQVAVDTQWVKKVRYFSYPDRLRLVLETDRRFLNRFSANPVDNGLLINVGKAAGYPGGAIAATRHAPSPAGGAYPVTAAMDSANRLQSIYATQLQDATMVTIRGDGVISDYKVGTVSDPAAIVFDIQNIANPYEAENAFPVDTRWVRQVSHETYPDKVRVRIDTRPEYLSNFSAFPDKNGLVIYVGRGNGMAGQPLGDMPRGIAADAPGYITADAPAPPAIDSLPAASATSAAPAVEAAGEAVSFQPAISAAQGPAWVNRIDFLSEEAGKSTLIIGTSQPVRYDMETPDDRRLKLKIFNAKTPDYRQRPLITNQFESAVDRIMPRQEKAGADAVSVIDIDLREGVPFYVERSDNTLMVHFEASSIPPATMGGTAPPEIIAGSQYPSAGQASDFSQGASAAGAYAPEQAPQSTSRPMDATTAMGDRYPMAGQIPQGGAPYPPHAPARSGPSQPPQFDPLTANPPMTYGDFDMPRPAPGRFDMPQRAAVAEASGGGGLDDVLDDELLMASEPKYTGEPIALDFYETDIKNVFRILREVSGRNFAVDQDVSGRVTLTLEHPVPWDQVLDLVLKMNQLGKTMEGNIIRIATQVTLKKEEDQRQERLMAQRTVKDQEKALEPLVTEYIPVSYSDAETEIRPHLEKIVTKDRGSISVDKRTNMVILTDTAETVRQAKEIVEKLDRVTPQVLIEARIVEATINFTKQIGVRWSTNFGLTGDTVDAGAIAGIGSGPQRAYNLLGGTYGTDIAVDLPSADSAGSIGFNFTRIAGSPFILNAMLMAMESQREGRVISAPRILTLDNKPAIISQGVEVPYQTRDKDGQTEVSFKNVDLLLNVTPHITPDNRISMKIQIDNNEVSEQTADGPALATNSASTELLVNDGDTFVIGGIIKETEITSDAGLPGLSKIPIIGWLFKSRSNEKVKRELLIFITPRIVQLEQRQMQL